MANSDISSYLSSDHLLLLLQFSPVVPDPCSSASSEGWSANIGCSSANIQNSSGSIQVSTANIQGLFDSSEVPLASIQGLSASIQSSSAKIGCSSANIQNSSNSSQGLFDSSEGSFASIQGLSASTEGLSANIQGPPSTQDTNFTRDVFHFDGQPDITTPQITKDVFELFTERESLESNPIKEGEILLNANSLFIHETTNLDWIQWNTESNPWVNQETMHSWFGDTTHLVRDASVQIPAHFGLEEESDVATSSSSESLGVNIISKLPRGRKRLPETQGLSKRERNNFASRKTREKLRLRHTDLKNQSRLLLEENDHLRIEVKILQELVAQLKEYAKVNILPQKAAQDILLSDR